MQVRRYVSSDFVQKSLFNWTPTWLECSWQVVANISHVWHWNSLNLCFCRNSLTFSTFTNNITAYNDKVMVEQELLWMIIQDMSMKKKEDTLCIYLKRKCVRGNCFWKQFGVCELHKRFCISTSELLSKFFNCAKSIKATNLLKLYMNCNFSQSITETLTMLAPMLGLDQYFTVRRHEIVTLIYFHSKPCLHKIIDILASCQRQRMTIVISASTV